MKKQAIFLIAILNVISCGEVGTSYEQVTAIKTVSQRLNDINKTITEIKNLEDQVALVLEEPFYLEYEYPVRENESYVTKYHFDDSGCFKIKIDTYFNKQGDAEKITEAIIKDLQVNSSFGTPQKEFNLYLWEKSNSKISIELNIQHIERGTISLTIFKTIS